MAQVKATTLKSYDINIKDSWEPPILLVSTLTKIFNVKYDFFWEDSSQKYDPSHPPSQVFYKEDKKKKKRGQS